MIQIQEAIEYCQKKSNEIYAEAFLCHSNPNDELLDGKIHEAKIYETIVHYLKCFDNVERAVIHMREPTAQETFQDISGQCHSQY